MSSNAQSAGPLPPPRDPYTARVEPVMTRLERFWQRVTEGMQLNELWKQFRADARSSYQLYAREVDSTRTPGVGRAKHFFGVAGQFFWAIILKLTPARRVLLLVALVFMFAPSGEASWQSSEGGLRILTFDGHFWGALLMLVLLVLEVGDRVVMKRDLQIAKEIQAWLLPPNPPQVPGLEIAFATRPANTVAGDYYDVFPRPSSDSSGATFLIAIADVAGKSIPAAMLMATFQASLKTLSAMSGSLTELVGRMNTYACSNSQNGRRFTTTFLAEYDPRVTQPDLRQRRTQRSDPAPPDRRHRAIGGREAFRLAFRKMQPTNRERSRCRAATGWSSSPTASSRPRTTARRNTEKFAC